MGFHISPCTGTNTASFISHQEKGQLARPHQELGSKKGRGDVTWHGDMAELEEEEGRSAPEFPPLHISYLLVLQPSLLLLHWGEGTCPLEAECSRDQQGVAQNQAPVRSAV